MKYGELMLSAAIERLSEPDELSQDDRDVCVTVLNSARHEIERLNAGWQEANKKILEQGLEIERLRTLLTEATEDIESWDAYEDDYFGQKRDL